MSRIQPTEASASMPKRTDIPSFLIIGAALALSGCATARMHSQAELSFVERQCKLAAGELFQDESGKKLLFLFRVAPTAEEQDCVAAWARSNHLLPVFIEAANEPES